MRYIGTHPVDNGGIDMAVRRSANAGMKAVQIFTAIPKYYGDKVSIRPERVERFRAALEETGIEARMVMAHAAYVLNTATPEDDKWSRARGGLVKELERSTMLGIGSICFHPGAATDGDRDAAAKRVATAIVDALQTHPESRTRVLSRTPPGPAAPSRKPPTRSRRSCRTCPRICARGRDTVSTPVTCSRRATTSATAASPG
jgi:deoxyribonuclease IV